MRKPFIGLVMTLTFFIIIPLLLILLWSVVGRWPWPSLLPESYQLRTVKELVFGSHGLPRILLSSLLLSSVVALLSTIIALMASRAIEVQKVFGGRVLRFLSLLIFVVPATVFAMGIHMFFVRHGLADRVIGVILVHLVMSLPYSMNILLDVTKAVGKDLEEQAISLGAHPFKAFFNTSLYALIPGLLSSFSMAFIISYSQYFTTLIIGGGSVKTIALVLIPYIQAGDRALASAFAVAFVGSAMVMFFILEYLIKKGGSYGSNR